MDKITNSHQDHVIQSAIDTIASQLKESIEAMIDATIEETYQRLYPPMQIVVNENAISPETRAELEQQIEKWHSPQCYVMPYPDYEAMWRAIKRYPGVDWYEEYVLPHNTVNCRPIAGIMAEIEQRFTPKLWTAPDAPHEGGPA